VPLPFLRARGRQLSAALKKAVNASYLCSMESTRQKKVNRLLQRDLGSYFQQNGTQFVKGSMITVTGVRVSPDLGIAKVYLSIFGGDEPQAIVDAITKRSWQVRKDLAAKVRNQLRVTPNLSFFLDDSLDHIENIDDLLKNG
jgi:ribosome-binding factor A